MRRAIGGTGGVVRHYPLAGQETHLRLSRHRDAGFILNHHASAAPSLTPDEVAISS